MREMTIRDLQRVLAHCQRPGHHMYYHFWQCVKRIAEMEHLSVSSSGSIDLDKVKPVVDRMAARYGPKTPLFELLAQLKEQQEAPLTSGEERKKGTDEAYPASSQTSNDTHGGDGRSGEVPDGHSQSGNAGRDSRQVADQEQQSDACEESKEDSGDQGNARGQGTADPRAAEPTDPRVGAAETGSDPTPQVEMGDAMVQGPSLPEDSAAQDQQERSGEADREKKCDEGQAAEDALPGASADNDAASADRTISDDDTALAAPSERNPNQVGEGGDPSEINAKEARKAAKHLARMTGKVSRTGRNAHGGITAELRQAKISMTIVRRVRAVLASWTADGGQDEQSNRWDYPRLAARLLTRRSPHPARKEELGRPVLLVLADVSGSCAGFSDESLLVARAIAAQGLPGCDVLVVSHSNGDPQECELNGKSLPVAQHRRYTAVRERTQGFHAANVAFYEAMIADFQITHVIALGDHDAEDVYTMLAELPSCQQVLWLDNYACNWHRPRLDDPGIRRSIARSKMRYVTGCKDAAAFVQGLRVALQG